MIQSTDIMKRLVRREVIIHSVFWIIYIFNEVVSFYIQSGGEYTFGSIIIKELVLHIPIIGVFYLNYSFLIPRYLLRGRHLVFGLAWIAIFPLRWVLYYVDSLFLDWYFASGTFFIDYTVEVWSSILLNTVFYLLMSTGAKFSRDWFFNRKRIEELERQKRDAELALLQYQINPHFLFNTLNNIYALVKRQSPEAPEAILRFSNIMRYAMTDVFAERVELRHEIDYLKSFIELQQLRLPRPETVRFDVTGDPDGLMVSPMIFIPFVENAFKHGDTVSADAAIDVRLETGANTVFFSVTNKTADKRKDTTGGIGIPNVSRRLEMIYPGRHKLTISPGPDNFSVTLNLEVE